MQLNQITGYWSTGSRVNGGIGEGYRELQDLKHALFLQAHGGFMRVHFMMKMNNLKYKQVSSINRTQGKILKFSQCPFLFFIYLFLGGCTHNIGKFLGQESNLRCSCNLCHSHGNARSFIHCTTAGTPQCPFIFIFIFWLFKATPAAYGGSQARDQTRAYATATATPDLSCICNLHHSSQQCQILTLWARPGIEPATSWFLVGFISAAPWWELQSILCVYKENIH